jgi:hypothetical protein
MMVVLSLNILVAQFQGGLGKKGEMAWAVLLSTLNLCQIIG